MVQLEGFDRVLERERLEVDRELELEELEDFGFARDDVEREPVDFDAVDDFGFARDDVEREALDFAVLDVLVDFGFARDDPVDFVALDRARVGVVREPAAARAAPVTRERAPDSSSATRAASVSSWVRISRTSSTTRRSSRVCRMRPVAAETCSTTSR
jgi:hypothetical protein